MKNVKTTLLDFPLFLLTHPFKGFDEMKHLKRGDLRYSLVILILLGMVTVYGLTSTGFIVAGFFNENPNIFLPGVIVFTYAPILLFCMANWSITSITEGKGTFKQIFLTYTYALYPVVFLTAAGVAVSNVVTAHEVAFAAFFPALGQVLFYFYLFVGLIIIHEYTFTKAIVMTVLTVLAMMIIVFVLALFISLLSELVSLFFTLAYEMEAHL